MGNENWETPNYFFERCEAAWGPFGMDAAASDDNSKCDYWITEEENALDLEWEKDHPFGLSGYHKNVWLNPPYTNLIAWVNKAIEESNKGLRVVMLLPNDTDTRWFHILNKRAEIYLIKGRIKFIDPEGNGRNSPRQGHLIAVLYPPIHGLIRSTGVVGTIRAG